MGVRQVDHRDELDLYRENIELVAEAIKRFLDKKPYGTRGHYDTYTQEFVMWARVFKPVPHNLRSLVGSTCGSMRTALEYLANAVVRANGRPTFPKRIQFPIFDTPEGYVKDALGKRGCVAEASPAAQAIFEALQPYKRGDPIDDPLWILHELARKHRHNEPVLTGALYENSTVGLDVYDAPYTAQYVASGPFKNGTEVLRIRFGIPLGDHRVPSMHMKSDMPVTVAFAVEGPARGRPIVQTLESIRDHIRDFVFPNLERFL